MKCIKRKSSGAVSRVKDAIAHELVRKGNATYIPKQEYRELRRKPNASVT